MLVDKCNEVQGQICQYADSIKIDYLTKVQDITDIDKKTYLDFVNICALKNKDKSGVKILLNDHLTKLYSQENEIKKKFSNYFE